MLSMCQFMVRGWPRMRTWAEQNRFSNSLELLVKGGLHVASFGADIVGLRRDPLTGGPLTAWLLQYRHCTEQASEGAFG